MWFFISFSVNIIQVYFSIVFIYLFITLVLVLIYFISC